LLRYEDLIADAARELRKVVDFLALSATPEQIAQAVERSSADRMRQLEKGPVQHSLFKGTRNDLSFVRAAGSGGWRKDLPAPQVARIEAAWGHLMQHLRYELSSQPAEVREYASLGIPGTPGGD
jgi:hypothetical protein